MNSDIENQQIDLSQYGVILRRWWWLLLACAIVAGGSAFLGTTQMPRIYQATSTVIVGQTLEQVNPTGQDFYISQQLAETYREMVKRRPILTAAAQSLELSYVPSPANVTARTVPATQLLEISVRDTEPERARLLADEIAGQLIYQSPTADPGQDERREFIRAQLVDLEAKIQQAGDEIRTEQARLEQSNSARAIQQHQANIQALEAKRAGYQNTYAQLLPTIQGGSNRIEMFEAAILPTHPISPRVGATVGSAAAIGLALALAGVFLIEYLDNTVRSAEEVSRLSQVPVIASIARLSGQRYPEQLITVKDPLSPVSEAFRGLRTGVRFASVDKPLRTLMVASAGPSEGKSVTAANLAVVFAESGQHVLLVDSDLRRPVQHRVFRLSNLHGLTDAIMGSNPTILEHVQKTEVANLDVLTSGDIPPNPSELLGSDRMTEVIEELKGYFDLIVFDSPPTLVVTDASILGSRVDGVLLVTDSGQTHRRAVERTADQLRRAQASLLGAVLNRAGERGAGYGYGYGYYQYRYSQGSDDDSNGQGDAKSATSRHEPSRRERAADSPRARRSLFKRVIPAKQDRASTR
jgi:polysaccharide biosynthesis transport protein